MDQTATVRKAIEDQRAVLVLGTGVSTASAVDASHCSWIDFLAAGIEYIAEHGLIAHEPVLDNIRDDLEVGAKYDNTYLLTAGEKIVNALGGKSSPHFEQLLSMTVGSIQPDPKKYLLVENLAGLSVPIITTNYDTIVEQITGRSPAPWTDARAFAAVLKSESADIAHLHGTWNRPDSVILTTSDYERIVRDTVFEALRQSIGLLDTIVFVGYGAGLNDPHFSALWNWLQPLRRVGAIHFTLCRDSDVKSIVDRTKSSPVIPIGYGADHSDLPKFIESLTPSSISTVGGLSDRRIFGHVRDSCRRNVLDFLSDTTVLPKVVEMVGTEHELDELVIEPVLLPVPPEQFANEHRTGQKLEYLDPQEVLSTSSAVTLVGEEQSGVTTALAWSLIKICDDSNCIPIRIDYHKLTGGLKPIHNNVRKHLRHSGAPLDSREPLPSRVALAIDNVSPSNERNLKRMVNDVIDLNPQIVIFGCRPGTEIYVHDIYADRGAVATPAYLGKLNRRHAIELAKRVDPLQAGPVADRVLEIAKKEGLSRTPLSLTLLIMGVVSDEGWINTVSNTSFIDSFIDSLLGRGGIRDDMRLQIDASGYSRVLEALSIKIVHDDVASLPRMQVLNYISEVFSSLDWSDRPEDVLNALIAKGILVDRSNMIKFRQSAYFHVLAARAARVNGSLLERLKKRPLYYSPIIRHYAALQRDDDILLKWAIDLLAEAEGRPMNSSGIFRELTSEEIDADSRQIESFGNSETIDVEPTVQGTRRTEDGDRFGSRDAPDVGNGRSEEIDEDHDDRDDFDPYDALHDHERDPFPSDDLENAPEAIRLPAQLTLVSNILRDSELVQDPELKESGLMRTLRVSSVYLDNMYSSHEVKDLVDRIIDTMLKYQDLPPDKVERLRAGMVETWSVMAFMSHLDDELATIKLGLALNRILKNADNRAQANLVVPALLLRLIIDGGKWNRSLTPAIVEHSRSIAMRNVVDVFLMLQYSLATDGAYAEKIEEAIIEFRLAPYSSAGPQRMRRLRAGLVRALRFNKAETRALISMESRRNRSITAQQSEQNPIE
ncbi:SIR2 family protein [Nocardia thraciensis]